MCEIVSIDAAAKPTPPDVATAVISGIADIRGVDPLDLDFRLGEEVDTDALDALFGHASRTHRDVRIAFEIGDCDVAVESAGTVRVSRSCENPHQCGSGDSVGRCNA